MCVTLQIAEIVKLSLESVELEKKKSTLFSAILGSPIHSKPILDKRYANCFQFPVTCWIITTEPSSCSESDTKQLETRALGTLIHPTDQANSFSSFSFLFSVPAQLKFSIYLYSRSPESSWPANHITYRSERGGYGKPFSKVVCSTSLPGHSIDPL